MIMSDNPVTAHFSCARLMGFDPYLISHLAQAAQVLGNGDVQRIDQTGRDIAADGASVFGFARVSPSYRRRMLFGSGAVGAILRVPMSSHAHFC